MCEGGGRTTKHWETPTLPPFQRRESPLSTGDSLSVGISRRFYDFTVSLQEGPLTAPGIATHGEMYFEKSPHRSPRRQKLVDHFFRGTEAHEATSQRCRFVSHRPRPEECDTRVAECDPPIALRAIESLPHHLHFVPPAVLRHRSSPPHLQVAFVSDTVPDTFIVPCRLVLSSEVRKIFYANLRSVAQTSSADIELTKSSTYDRTLCCRSYDRPIRIDRKI